MNVKNEVFVWKGCIFFDFRGLQDKDRFGAVLEGSGGRFSELFGRFWVDFGALKRSPILKPKLEAKKVVLGTRKGLRPEGQAALILIVDQPIIDNIDRRGHWNRRTRFAR